VKTAGVAQVLTSQMAPGDTTVGSRPKRGGAAIAGDVRVDGPAGFVTGHQSRVSVNLTVAGKDNDAYERRHAVYRTTPRLIEEAHSQFASETLKCFLRQLRTHPFYSTRT
jgi:hypothetical protein